MTSTATRASCPTYGRGPTASACRCARLLDAELGPGVTELTCHAGYVDEGLASSYTVEREAELRTLCDPRVRPALAERRIRLAGFRDLAALVGAPSVAEGAA